MSGFAIGTAVVAAVGAGYAGYSSYQQGQNANKLAQFQAANERAANEANLKLSAVKSLAEREQNQKILATQEAMFAASGVVTNTGSPLSTEVRQAALLERRAVNTDYEGTMAARYGASQVISTQMQGDAAAKAGKMNAGATLLQGASNTAGTYYKMS